MHVCGNTEWYTYILPLSRYPECEYAITTRAQTTIMEWSVQKGKLRKMVKITSTL